MVKESFNHELVYTSSSTLSKLGINTISGLTVYAVINKLIEI